MIREQFLDYCQGLKQALDAIPTDAAERFLQLLETAYREGRQVFLMGNGGSGATASHAAGDLNKGVSYGREKRFRVISLNDNLATLTAYANNVSSGMCLSSSLRTSFARAMSWWRSREAEIPPMS